jgi:hypothetical protein
MNLAQASKAVGKNSAYLQQFVRRGIPRVLPEDIREALAALLEVSPSALRGSLPAKGGPRTASPQSIAATEEEGELLRRFRLLSPETQATALRLISALK